MKQPDVLAPAGGSEALIAALRSGADAVYIGGKQFSARNNASNFTNEQLADAVKLCHIRGAKLFLAVNTLISDGEAADFCRFIKFTAELGVDGYIVQDLGAVQIIRSAVPNAVIHGSTQLSVHTISGVKLLADMGFSRAVPARELSAEVLEKMCRENIEIEAFVHGALCMSVSGQCYMSAVIGSRSANRGVCGQACRLPFSAVGKKDRSALSLKDLSLLENAETLRSIGVDSLKIEGRMKRPEYVASAVHELKNALDGKAPDMKTLRGVFSRGGFTDGYFSRNLQNMFGVREKDDVISAKDILPTLHELYRSERKSYKISIHADIKANTPVTVTASCGNISAAAKGDFPEAAKNSPVTADSVSKKLLKLGDTVFECEKFTADIDDGLFVTAGKLNELRRTVTEKLSENILEANRPKYTITDYLPAVPKNVQHSRGEVLPVRTMCRTTEQAYAAAALSEYVIIPDRLISAELCEKINTEKIIASPPRFIVDEDKLISRLSELKKLGIEHLLCHTLDSVSIGKMLGFRLHGSFTMNLFNSFTAEYLRQLGLEDCTASIECTLRQLEALSSEMPVGAVIYGRLPLMLTRNCPVKNEIGCKNCTHQLIDRTSRKLPVVCSEGYSEILNSDILYMGDRLEQLGNSAFGVVILHNENESETLRAISLRKPDSNITRGLYYRGVFDI